MPMEESSPKASIHLPSKLQASPLGISHPTHTAMIETPVALGNCELEASHSNCASKRPTPHNAEMHKSATDNRLNPEQSAKWLKTLEYVALTVFAILAVGYVGLLTQSAANKPNSGTTAPTPNYASQSVSPTPLAKQPEEILVAWFQDKLDARKQEIFNDFHPMGQAQSLTVHDVSIEWKENRPRNDLRNILQATVRFTITWTSPLHNDGFTKISATYDNESERFTSAEILATNGTTTQDAAMLTGAVIGSVIQYESEQQGH